MTPLIFRSLCLSAVLILPSCIRNVSPPIRKIASQLVVEGWITTDAPPYTIKLSYSGQFSNAYLVPENLYISDARVVLRDDRGDSSICPWISGGTYQSADSNFVGTVGRTYTLSITLSSGKNYVSKPEKISPVPAIDSLTVFYDSSYIIDVRPSQFILSAHSPDPAGVQNYYRWTADGYVPRKSSGGPCSISSPPCGLTCTCFALCEQFTSNDEINVLSDQFIDGKEIIQPVFYSPIYWFGIHYLEVRQYSLTKAAFTFWEAYLDQTNRTGSILDPLPAPLLGNVYNPVDSSDIALGLFSASATSSAKIIITPEFLQQYWLLDIGAAFIPLGDCHMDFANSLPDDIAPLGWSGADSIVLH
jgi:hypothetical protein